MPTTPSRNLLSSALALLALGTLLAPLGGSTRAAWSAGASVSVPPLTNDTVAITVTPQETTHPLPSTETTLTVRNESRRWAASVTPSASVTPLDPDLDLTVPGLDELVNVSYRDCQSDGPLAGPLAVPPSDSGVLCAEVTTPQTTGTDLLLDHAGQGVTVTHQVTREPVAGTAWTAQASTTTTHSLDFPRPTHPGDQLTRNGVCTSPVLVGNATIKWAWPDTASAGSIESRAVKYWQLQRLDDGDWFDTGDRIDSSARSTTIPSGTLGLLDSASFRIVGYSEAEPSVPVTGTYQVTIRKILDLLGISVGTTCGETKSLP